MQMAHSTTRTTTQANTTDYMKFGFDVFFMTILYVGGVLALNADLTQVITVIGASLGGAAALAYFRRDRDHKEIFYKTGIAATCGLVSGAMIIEYWAIVSTPYTVGVHFYSSLLSLFLIRELVNLIERNSAGLIVTIFQTLTRTRLPNRITPESGNSQELNGGQTIKTDIVVSSDAVNQKPKE